MHCGCGTRTCDAKRDAHGVYLRRPSAVLGMLRNRGSHRCHFLPRRTRRTAMLNLSGRRTIDRPIPKSSPTSWNRASARASAASPLVTRWLAVAPTSPAPATAARRSEPRRVDRKARSTRFLPVLKTPALRQKQRNYRRSINNSPKLQRPNQPSEISQGATGLHGNSTPVLPPNPPQELMLTTVDTSFPRSLRLFNRNRNP